MEIKFLNYHTRLSHEDSLYWKELLFRTVKIGIEIEVALPMGQMKNAFLPAIIEELKPSEDMNNLGENGVYNIISEHCGIELQVIGRKPYFRTLHRQYKQIVDVLLSKKVRTLNTCGLHFHIMVFDLSEKVPDVIMANVWNITKEYAPFLKFITSGGNRLSGLCRRRNYNSHLELEKITAGKLVVKDIYKMLKKSDSVPFHQNFLSLQPMTFNGEGLIDTFHYEYRFPDIDISPFSIVAKTFLFLAILLKAIELSQYGVLDPGNKRVSAEKWRLMNALSNNDGDLAASDTSSLTLEDIKKLKRGSKNLLRFLKPLFNRFEGNPSYEILEFLADTPISMLRIHGLTWEEIEEMLSIQASRYYRTRDKIDENLIKCIELMECNDCETDSVWMRRVADSLQIDVDELSGRLKSISIIRPIIWDEDLGSIIFSR